MAKLTEAGRNMIALFLRKESEGRGLITATDGQAYMMLPKGEGAVKSALMKLKRDGFAQGRWDRWTTPIMRPTEAGRAAHAACGFQPKFCVGDNVAKAGSRFSCGFVRSIHQDAKGTFYIVGFGSGKFQTRGMDREEALVLFERVPVAA